MSELITTPPVEPAPAPENSTIREMRAEIERLKTEHKAEKDLRTAAEQKAVDLEREKLTETERVRLELEDARREAAEGKSAKSALTSYDSTFEELYNAEIEAAPEDKRESLKRVTAAGSWPDRIKTLKEAKSLLGTPARPIAGGSITNPATPAPNTGTPPPNVPKPFDPDAIGSWATVLKPVSSGSGQA